MVLLVSSSFSKLEMSLELFHVVINNLTSSHSCFYFLEYSRLGDI